MNLVSTTLYAASKLWQHGPIDFSKRCWRHFIRKESSIPLYKLTIKSRNISHCHHYADSPDRQVEIGLSMIPLNPTECTFVDIGCGTGKVLKVAQKHGFKRLIGVEFAKELYDVAVACRPYAEFYNVDAALFEFPTGPLVIYMYNPFDGVVMDKVMRRIPVGTYIIYYQPREQETVSRHAELISQNGMVSLYKK